MKPHHIILPVLIAISSLAQAEWRDIYGNVRPDSSSVKGIGPLSAQLFFRKSKDETIQNWGRLARAIFIASQPIVKRNDSIVAMVGFNGCTMTSQRQCNLAVSFKVFAPSGVIYGESNETELWQREEPNTGNVLMPGVGFLEVRIEPSDELGHYVVEAVVTDRNSKATVTLTSRFQAVE